MDEDLRISERLIIPGRELEEKVSRASGPGGQHVNKTSTRVTLRWRPADSAIDPEVRDRLLTRLRLTKEGWLAVHVDEARSQLQNRLSARDRLAAVVAAVLVEQKKRRPTKPSRGSKQERLTTKRTRGSVKQGRGRVTDD